MASRGLKSGPRTQGGILKPIHFALGLCLTAAFSAHATTLHKKQNPPPVPGTSPGTFPSQVYLPGWDDYRPTPSATTPTAHSGTDAPKKTSGCRLPHPLDALTTAPDYFSVTALRGGGAYFLSDEGGAPRLYREKSAGADPEPISEPGIKSYAPSRLGWQILWQTAASPLVLYDTTVKKATPLAQPGERVESYAWGPTASWIVFVSNRRNPAELDLWRYRLSTKKTEKLATLPGFSEIADVAPDGKQIALVHALSPTTAELLVWNELSHRLVRVGPELPFIASQPARERVAFANASTLFFLAPDRRGTLQLHSIHHSGRKLKPLTSETSPVESFALDAERQKLVLLLNRDGYSSWKGFTLDTSGALLRPLALPPPPAEVVTSVSIPSSLDPLLFFTASGAHVFPLLGFSKGTTPEIWQGGERTDGCFDGERLVHFGSFDRTVLSAFVYKPSLTRNGSSVIYVHDGPDSQFRPSFHPDVLYLARLGYTVVAPNYRGGTGQGDAFRALDDGPLRGNVLKDIVVTADWIRANVGPVETRPNLFGMGYGGTIALSTARLDPPRFGRVSAVKPVHDWAALVKAAPSYLQGLLRQELGEDATLAALLPWPAAGASPATLVLGDDERAPASEHHKLAAQSPRESSIEAVKWAARFFESSEKKGKGP